MIVDLSSDQIELLSSLIGMELLTLMHTRERVEVGSEGVLKILERERQLLSIKSILDR